MPSLRTERVRELLKRELGEIIRREIPVTEIGLITVNDVQVSGDLQSAAVYIGILGDAEKQKKGLSALNHHRKHIQGLIGKAVVLKYTPHVRFLLDNSVDQGNKVLKIIDELESLSPTDENPPEDN